MLDRKKSQATGMSSRLSSERIEGSEMIRTKKNTRVDDSEGFEKVASVLISCYTVKVIFEYFVLFITRRVLIWFYAHSTHAHSSPSELQLSALFSH